MGYVITLNATTPYGITQITSPLLSVSAIALTICTMFAAKRYEKLADKRAPRVPYDSLMALRAFRAYEHLSKYLTTRSHHELTDASKFLDQILTQINNRWSIVERVRTGRMKGRDYETNPVVEITAFLLKSVKPLLEGRDSHLINQAAEFLYSLAEYYTNQPDVTLAKVLESGRKLPVAPAAEGKKPQNFVASRPILKYGIIYAIAAIVSGMVTYYMTAPYANGDTLRPVELALAVVGIATAVFGLLVFDNRRPRSGAA